MITDPVFYLVAVPAVLLLGVAKGGFAGLGLVAVPLLALTISPVQAAGILLPILLAMDAMSVWIYRRTWDLGLLKLMLPFAAIGIGAGALTAGLVDDNSLRLMLGVLVMGFLLLTLWQGIKAPDGVVLPRWVGAVCGWAAGITSFIAHAGSPPFQIYVLPMRLDRLIYVGTKVMFFAAVNVIKILPFALLGQLSPANLTTSLVLMPLVPLGVITGAWLVRRASNDVFYMVIYALLAVVGVKLIMDGWPGIQEGLPG